MGRDLKVYDSFTYPAEKAEPRMPVQHRRMSSIDLKRQKETDERRMSIYILLASIFAVLTYFAFAGVSPSTHIKLQEYVRVVKDTTRLRSKGTAIAPMRIFMYELPDDLDKDIRTAWYQDAWLNNTAEYNSDLWVYDFIANSPHRTKNPEEATLFYIPIYPTRRLHLQLHTHNWQDSIEISVNYSRTALWYIREHFPYWDKHKGRDHFTTLTGDHARCLHFTGMSRQDFGEMFTLQHLGDLVLSNQTPGIPRHRDGETDIWSCYRAGWDILLPAYLPSQEIETAGVFEQQRDITALYRFDLGTATSGHPYHNVNVRRRLKEMYDSTPLPGANWKTSSLTATLNDMARSVFCISPPGVVAHTSRYWRALLRGCIPVSYYQAYDLAFQDQLDYDSFTVNLSPYDVRDTHNRLATRLHDEKSLNAMQKALAAVQSKLNWETGIPELLTNALQRRSRDLQLWARVHAYETKVWDRK